MNKQYLWVKVRYIREEHIPVIVNGNMTLDSAFEEYRIKIMDKPPEKRLSPAATHEWQFEQMR